MGYKRAKTVKLRWADGDFDGLEVRAKRVSMKKFLRLIPLIDNLGNISEETVEEFEKLLGIFGDLIVDWNLEDEDTDEPVPCTAEAFIEQDPEFITEIIRQYAMNIAGVAAPLEQPSSSGEPFQEASLPMDEL